MMDWSLINFIDIAGTFVFAVSGIMVAIQKKFDFFGVIILAFVTSVGGGTLRDLMIGSTPVAWMKSEVHVITVLAAVPICYFLSGQLQKARKTFLIFDTLGIGLFTILGIEKSLEIGLSPVVAVMMGIVSAVFGGVLRDVLSNDVPMVFRKEIYAFACLSGALAYIGLNLISDKSEINMLLAISVVIAIRLLSLRNKWSIPFNVK
ncbi:MAG: trimeric intracellular cation channel family protein [Flavobacteriales bacterium]|nr:trimeric intracellular cation channel family protein [Flavobacteriales bacterium]